MEESFMKKVYPTFIAEYEGVFLVYVPDMNIYTEGNSFVDAIEMARDAIGLKGIDIEDDAKSCPHLQLRRRPWKKPKRTQKYSTIQRDSSRISM